MGFAARVVVGLERVEQPAHRGHRQRETEPPKGVHRGEGGERIREQIVRVVHHDPVAEEQTEYPDDCEVEVIDDGKIVHLEDAGVTHAFVAPVAATFEGGLHQGHDE